MSTYKYDEIIDIDKMDVLTLGDNGFQDYFLKWGYDKNMHYRIGIGYSPDGRGVKFIVEEITDYKVAYCNYAHDGDTCNNDEHFDFHFFDGKWVKTSKCEKLIGKS